MKTLISLLGVSRSDDVCVYVFVTQCRKVTGVLRMRRFIRLLIVVCRRWYMFRVKIVTRIFNNEMENTSARYARTNSVTGKCCNGESLSMKRRHCNENRYYSDHGLYLL